MRCCVCLQKTHQNISIFDNFEIDLNVADIVNKHLWFKTLLNDELNLQICTECWQKIYDFHQFYVTVEKAHKEFDEKATTDIKEESSASLSNIKQEEEDNYGSIAQIEIEIDNVGGSAVINFDLPSNSKNPLDDYIDSDRDGGVYENDGDSEVCATSEISDEDYEPVEKKDKCNRIKEKRKIIDNSSGSKAPKNVKASKRKRIYQRLDPKTSEEVIKKHIQMACNLCLYVGNAFADIVEHFKDNHKNVKPFIMCCDKKLTRSYCIAQHAYIHENPNSFSCAECNKSFTTSYGLRVHNISYHASEEERSHACEQCPRKFGRRNLLEFHKQTHIPKDQWNVVCTKCTKRTAKFATQYMLNIHTSMYHRREKNICQVCAKEIKDKKSFEKHVRSHFENSGPRLKCPIENCESWLKDEDNLKTHIQRYHLDDKTYKCPDCERICPNRRSLSSHKHYFHSKEIFRCEQCDKTFKKALTLKEHMTQHTGEILYNCQFCTKTFNSNANMHSHKKKQHPVEWEELRRKKQGPSPN